MVTLMWFPGESGSRITGSPDQGSRIKDQGLLDQGSRITGSRIKNWLSACCAYQCKKIFLVSRQVLSLKKLSRKAKNWFNSLMYVLEIFPLLPPCILQGTRSNNSVGRCNFITFPINCQIKSLVKCHRKQRLKRLFLSKWFFRCIP